MGATVGRRMDEATLERVQLLRPIADRPAVRITQLALAWILREQNVARRSSARRVRSRCPKTLKQRTSTSTKRPSRKWTLSRMNITDDRMAQGRRRAGSRGGL
jgi:hypothetical protein